MRSASRVAVAPQFFPTVSSSLERHPHGSPSDSESTRASLTGCAPQVNAPAVPPGLAGRDSLADSGSWARARCRREAVWVRWRDAGGAATVPRPYCPRTGPHRWNVSGNVQSSSMTATVPIPI